MNFDRYRDSMAQIQKLADNYASLTKADLSDLHRLNTECLSLSEGIVKTFSSLVDEIEEGLTLLLDRLDQIKKDLGKISGPEGTLGDILKLEPAWNNINSLRGSIRALLDTSAPAAGADAADNPPAPPTDGKAAPQARDSKDVKDLIVLAQKEAAATAEKSQASRPAPHVKVQKKEGPDQKKDSKPSSLVLNKNVGEAEKKLMAEISKNIEAIKGNRKK